jgi:hypothetical protein
MSAITDQRLGDAAFRVFCCLCGHADDETGGCRVSAATIAKEVGKARPTVVEHLNALKNLGYVRDFRPDDPIFNEGPQSFVPRLVRKRSTRNADQAADAATDDARGDGRARDTEGDHRD